MFCCRHQIIESIPPSLDDMRSSFSFSVSADNCKLGLPRNESMLISQTKTLSSQKQPSSFEQLELERDAVLALADLLWNERGRRRQREEIDGECIGTKRLKRQLVDCVARL